MTTKVDHPPRKRGRPAGEGVPRKRKQPAGAAAGLVPEEVALEIAAAGAAQAGHGPQPVGLGISHAQLDQPLPIHAGPPRTPQSAFLHQAQTLAPNVAPYTTVFAADEGMGNAPLFRTNVLVPYEYAPMYNYPTELDAGSESNDGASSGGPTAAPTPFSPMISHVPGPHRPHQLPHHLQQLPAAPHMGFNPYVPNMTNMTNFEVGAGGAAPQMAPMGFPNPHHPQPVHGLAIRPGGPFYDPMHGQMYSHPMVGHLDPQFNGQHFLAPSPMLQHAPTMQPPHSTSTPRLPATTVPVPNHVNATPRLGASQLPVAAHGHGHATPSPRLATAAPQGTPRLKTAPVTHDGSTPQRTPNPGHVATSSRQSSVAAPTPRLQSATLALQNAPTPHMSPVPLHAPTPMTCMTSPSVAAATPPPMANPPLHPPTPKGNAPNAPTPFASSASSDLSSVPPDSPVVTKQKQPAQSASSPKVTNSPLASTSAVDSVPQPRPQPPQRQMPPQVVVPIDHSTCISIEAHTATMNQLNSYKNSFQLLRSQLAKLVPADRSASEDAVMSIAKRIMESEGRINALANNEAMLRAELDKLATAKGETESHVHRLETELAIARQQAAQASAMAHHFQDECASQEQRNSGQESNNVYLHQQIDIRDKEIAALRANVSAAHDTLARLVAVSGIRLAEVQPASPTHLSPELERSRSHSFPLTPIYTPAQALPTESLPPSQSVLFSPNNQADKDDSAVETSETSGTSLRSEADLSPLFPTTPVRSNSLPIPATTPNAARFTPRLCLTPGESTATLGASLGVVADSGSPWKSWLQLDNMSSKN